MPLFSIIVPVYNSERTIVKCLDSILSQSFTDIEVIVINDGSTDKTLTLITEVSKDDPRVNLFSFPNSGISETRRRGIALSTGQYIIQVDSDDTINQGLLSILSTIIYNNEYPDIIRFCCEIIGDNPNKDHQRYNFNTKLYSPLSGIEALKLWSQPNKKYALYWLYCMKRSIFSELLFFPQIRCYEDVALIPLLIAKAQKVIGINYIGYNYTYANEFSITNQKDLSSERLRAIDFVKAYDFAIDNFLKLENINHNDLLFLLRDFDARKADKYNSLPKVLKEELYYLFH